MDKVREEFEKWLKYKHDYEQEYKELCKQMNIANVYYNQPEFNGFIAGYKAGKSEQSEAVK